MKTVSIRDYGFPDLLFYYEKTLNWSGFHLTGLEMRNELGTQFFKQFSRPWFHTTCEQLLIRSAKRPCTWPYLGDCALKSNPYKLAHALKGHYLPNKLEPGGPENGTTYGKTVFAM